MPRSQFIYSLRTKWKLIDAKITEENVIVWADNKNNNNNNNNAQQQQPSSSSASSAISAHNVINSNDIKADKIAKTIERIRNSRQEMESNREGIVIDQIIFRQEVGGGGGGGGGSNNNNNNNDHGGVVLRVGELATQQVSICNNSSTRDVHCIIKDSVARQRGIHIDRAADEDADNKDKDVVLYAHSEESITVSYTPKTFGIEKSIIVFEFTSAAEDDDDDYDDGDVKQFTITRYITIRSGDPDDYDIIKPTSPYVKKQRVRGDGNKFANPMKATTTTTTTIASSSSTAAAKSDMQPFRFNLGKYPIPNTLLRMDRNAVKEVMDLMYRGGGGWSGGVRGGTKKDDIDYSSSSLLTMENYSKCMHYLLWLEEVQMEKDITSYDLESALLRRDGRRFYTLRVPGLAESRPSVLKGDRIIISVGGRGKFEGIVQRTTNEDAIIQFAPSFHRVFIDGLRVDVRFTFSRTSLRTSHQALFAVNEHKHLFHKMLFPETLNVEDNPPMTPLNLRVIRSSQLKFYNRTLNREQESAVVGILQSIARPAPYLIYGPPVSKNV